MKKLLTLFIVFLSITPLFSQETELENFKQELNFYIDFTLGKITSAPVNEPNQLKYRKQVDDAFKKFVLQQDSYNYDKLVAVKDQENEKFIRLDDRISLYTKSFTLNKKTYVAYSYTSVSKMNFCIKENESNTLVYEGNSKSCFIDNLYAIDESHVLLIEENGDFNSSRSAYVLSSKNKPWTVTMGFKGNAFGQVAGDYSAKKFVEKRTVFQLECEKHFTFIAPQDINTISFDPATKTLSYKQYSDNKSYKTVSAKWDHEQFTIDDYNVNENLSESGY